MGQQMILSPLAQLRQTISETHTLPEHVCIERLVTYLEGSVSLTPTVAEMARDLISQARERYRQSAGMEGILQNYSLASSEGKSLMCLAEALLRIPDTFTQDKLIRDKMGTGDWSTGKSTTKLSKLSSWGLRFTQKLVGNQGGFFGSLVRGAAKPFVRVGTRESMKMLGQHFVMGETIEKSLKRAREKETRGYTYSYDMLGEAALTQNDADTYFASYRHALLSLKASKEQDLYQRPSISIKLSALHPQYELTHRNRVMDELLPRLRELAYLARDLNVGLTIDAEEARRFDLSLDLIQELFLDPQLQGWHGFGLALQAYQKRAFDTIDWLKALAQQAGRPLALRLVKGAYWDSEIKYAQVEGLDSYPVFTRKAATDISYLACMEKILKSPHAFYPQFASHNANTIAAVLAHNLDRDRFECQKLHGMGDFLFDPLLIQNPTLRCRIYAPVGGHKDLLSYLVRRLLENGANSSFINHIFDSAVLIDTLVENPLDKLRATPKDPHHTIPLPQNLYQPHRSNSQGHDLGLPTTLHKLQETLSSGPWSGHSIVNGLPILDQAEDRYAPHDPHHRIGVSHVCVASAVTQAFDYATQAFETWCKTTAKTRADILNRAADLLEERQDLFRSLCTWEAGKTLTDSLSEMREAVDFCRYYAERALIDFSTAQVLPGPTGEDNSLALYPRGTFLCISPWNFPLAIFLGQITGALAAGNCVVAKPASQTPLIATAAVQLLHEAGVPKDVLHLIIGSGKTVGDALLKDLRVSGVAFTGSTATAQHINQTLAAKAGPIVPFIAETGGINAMIVDASALPEQVAKDVTRSAFQSAGQRCSALRLLFLQEDVAEGMLEKIKGAMDQLTVGKPLHQDTHVGPVIDASAYKNLMAYIDEMKPQTLHWHQTPIGTEGMTNLVPPTLLELPSATAVNREIFGPILHVIRYKAKDSPAVMAAIHQTGYGLTLGIHSRIQETVDSIVRRARAGNIYVNRNMIGAVVGTQPFGGEGLSGTGPKAGGPRYLHRFAVERTVAIDTTAAGGNTALLSLGD